MAGEDEVTAVDLFPVHAETAAGHDGDHPRYQLQEADGVVQLGRTGVVLRHTQFRCYMMHTLYSGCSTICQVL